MKILKTISIILFIALLVGCGSSSGGDDPSLVGKWEMTQDDNGVAVPSGMYILIFSNTAYNLSGPNCRETGTYTTNGSIITSTIKRVSNKSTCENNLDSQDITNYNINGNTMTLTEGSGDIIILVRK